MSFFYLILKYISVLTLSTSVALASAPKSGNCSPKCAHHQKAYASPAKKEKVKPDLKTSAGKMLCHEKNSSGEDTSVATAHEEKDDSESDNGLQDLLRSANCSCDHARFVKTGTFLIQKKHGYKQTDSSDIKVVPCPHSTSHFAGFIPEIEPPPPRA